MPLITIDSECDTYTIEVSAADLKKIKKLMAKATDEGEWPDAVNDILDKYEPIETAGTLNTMGDGWGWYDNEE